MEKIFLETGQKIKKTKKTSSDVFNVTQKAQKTQKPSRVSFKKNKENPIHETDALAELVMLPALILLVSELPDSLSTDTITPTGALSHEWKNIKNSLLLFG